MRWIEDKVEGQQEAVKRQVLEEDSRRKRRTERTTPAEKPIPVLTTALLMQRSVCCERKCCECVRRSSEGGKVSIPVSSRLWCAVMLRLPSVR